MGNRFEEYCQRVEDDVNSNIQMAWICLNTKAHRDHIRKVVPAGAPCPECGGNGGFHQEVICQY